MELKVALVGNPNSGKTTLFNCLTGSNQFVGNWPGVTVEKKEGKYKNDKDISITDLPGIYSLSPYTLEEVISRKFLLNEDVDIIVNIVDGSHLERHLYLTTQLLELGIPVVVAINMLDVIMNQGDVIDFKRLSQCIGCPVVPISALKNDGIEELMREVRQSITRQYKIHYIYNQKIIDILKQLQLCLPQEIDEDRKYFYSLKLFERDKDILKDYHMDIDGTFISSYEKEKDDDSESIIADARYSYISSIMRMCYIKKEKEHISLTDQIDKIVTNRILALPIFTLIMWFIYYISITTVGTYVTDWTNDVLFGEMISLSIESFLMNIGCAAWLQSLIIDGIVAGVGAVLGFVPQMFVLFTFLAFLEECGYMPRVAFIMDRLFRKFGLSGKSFIPMLIGTGCGVPGIMASRTIESDRDRKMTIITTTFIPCSAKLPIIALISGSLFHDASWVAPSAYFIGMIAIIVSGIILKKTTIFQGNPAPFVMEMPNYHMPRLINICKIVWERGFSFIKKAGTIILLSSIILWLLQTYGFENHTFTEVSMIQNSLLAKIGQTFSWIFYPLGWARWEGAVASITGLIAKENVVSTFGLIFGEENMAMTFTTLSAYSFLVFNLLCAPCFAAIGAIKREMNNKKWTIFAISYQCLFAYVISLMIYQFGSLFIYGVFSLWTVLAFIILIIMIYMMFRKHKPILV